MDSSKLASASLLQRLFLKKFLVEGNSMSPLLHAGDIVYIKKIRNINVGDVVAARHPFRKKYIVKRVTSVCGENVELHGLNMDESEDSRVFGAIPQSDVLGKIVSKK